MPTRDSAPIGAPCWIDLMTSDTEASRSFYSDLFGWSAEEPSEEFGGYFMFMKDGRPVAGGMPAMPDANMTDAWSIYLATKDARTTADAAAAGGGQVIVPAMDVADLGSMAMVSDPGSAVIGIWQPKSFQGLGILAESGAPVWFELLTRDYDNAVSFYRDVFGCDTEVLGDTPEFRYTTLNVGGEQHAGIMDATGFLPDGAPSSWSVYFGVDDANASSARIVELGGSILREAQDTPYGRLASASDVNGAPFNIMGPNEAAPAGTPTT